MKLFADSHFLRIFVNICYLFHNVPSLICGEDIDTLFRNYKFIY
jgi:hypothetical protein